MRLLAISLSLATLMLAGCATKVETKEVVVTKVKTVVRVPPAALLADCPISKPPDTKAYIKKSYMEKEAALVDFAATQTANLGACNKDKAALRKWRDEQLKLSDDKK